MGDLPRITATATQALTLGVQSSWPDHHFQGRPVLPAVEAMQILAARMRADRPTLDVHTISNARFPKFLAIAPDRDSVETRCETTDQEDGGVQTALTSNVTVGAARIRRSVTHAELCFGGTVAPLPPMPLDLLAAMEGICTNVDPEVIYRELVPFGPRFRSICRPLVISADGALARVRAPAHADAYPGPLGSGFPLDGAFHAACVW
ncbi:polyketide synthase dehydratase domain-containing protein, partial [Desulfosarcina cetonica]|uniref:polyketide synthase dehydratase domain-containing protein n=1 Tax=Desulfosarcina cetonica TaxID=90730 RepID=UPI0006D1B9EC